MISIPGHPFVIWIRIDQYVESFDLGKFFLCCELVERYKLAWYETLSRGFSFEDVIPSCKDRRFPALSGSPEGNLNFSAIESDLSWRKADSWLFVNFFFACKTRNFWWKWKKWYENYSEIQHKVTNIVRFPKAIQYVWCIYPSIHLHCSSYSIHSSILFHIATWSNPLSTDDGGIGCYWGTSPWNECILVSGN